MSRFTPALLRGPRGLWRLRLTLRLVPHGTTEVVRCLGTANKRTAFQRRAALLLALGGSVVLSRRS